MPEAQTQEKVIQRPATIAGQSGAKVTVACKMPAGLRMRVFRMVEQRIVVAGSNTTDTIRVAEPFKKDGCDVEYMLNGNAVAKGERPKCQIILGPHGYADGYALTPNIPKDFWDLWLEQNKDAAYVKNHLVFAYEKLPDLKSVAKEHHKQLSGMEPFVPDGSDPRRVKSANSMISSPATARRTEGEEE